MCMHVTTFMYTQKNVHCSHNALYEATITYANNLTKDQNTVHTEAQHCPLSNESTTTQGVILTWLSTWSCQFSPKNVYQVA